MREKERNKRDCYYFFLKKGYLQKTRGFTRERDVHRYDREKAREKKKKGVTKTKAEQGEGRREEGRREGDFVLGWCWHYPWFPSGVGR